MPSGRATPGAINKVKSKQRGIVQSSDDELEVEQDDALKFPKYDQVEPEYLFQPINNDLAGVKVKTLIAELNNARKDLMQTIAQLRDVAVLFALNEASSASDDQEQFDGDNIPEDSDDLKRLDKEIRSALDHCNETKIRADTLNDLRQRLIQGHQIRDIWSDYNDTVQAPLDKYRAKTSRMKYAGDREYQNFRNSVFESRYLNNQGVPNIKKFIPAEEGDEEDDDDIEVGAMKVDFKCPLTAAYLKKAVTSTKCPHSFSGDAIREYLKAGAKPCPVSGCSKQLSLDDLQEDEGLQKRADAHKQREADHGPRGTQHNGTQYEMISDDEDA